MEPNGGVPEEDEKIRDPSQASSSSSVKQERAAKTQKILDACKYRDVEALRLLATSEAGLVSDDARRQACSCHLQRAMDEG
jgi:hypothetical protein